MSRVLIVEDSATQARQIGFMLQDAGFEVDTAGNGVLALETIARRTPDIVLTDLQMPEMNGLELVEAIRGRYPFVPVILMTAHGSEDIAVEALQKGAASYVPKRRLDDDLVSTLRDVLDVARADLNLQRLLECLMQSEAEFQLDNDTSLIPSLISHFQQSVTRMKLCDETGLIRMGVALHEALVNAMHHGNLELGSELREGDTSSYHDLAAQRARQRPYADRRVFVTATISRSQAVYVIRDEGRGFDPSKLPDPTDPANLEKVSGRGLLLIRTFMDQVHHNETGNEITMVKRRD